MKTTTKDNRSLTRLAKDIATMRRRVGAAIRKHQKLQERIAKLQADGRIVSIHNDAEIVAGVYNVWYVKSDSLNTPGAKWNWYYQVIFIEECNMYQCSCQDVRHGDCKHSKALGTYLHENVEVMVGNTRIVAARCAIDNAISHTEWSQEMTALARRKDAERVAAIEGGKIESRYFEQLRAMNEQYASDPRQGLSQAEVETAKANSRMFYDGI